MRGLKKGFDRVLTILIITLAFSNISLWGISNHGDRPEENSLEITFLDVGQGDSILIRSPNNLYGLIDSGRGSSSLDAVQRHYLHLPKKLEFVVLTHPDADHIEGFLEISKYFEIGTLFINKTQKENSLVSSLYSTIKNLEIKNFGLGEEDDFTFDGVEFNIIYPKGKLDTIFAEDSNATSIGIEIIYKDISIYSAGDLSNTEEMESVQFLKNRDIHILKAGHHGSNTSSSKEFLNTITPEFVVFSAGVNNSYGHPSEEVIQNFTEINSEIYRTDKHGDVKFKINDNGITIVTAK